MNQTTKLPGLFYLRLQWQFLCCPPFQLSSVLLSAVITLVIWCLKGPARLNRRTSQNISRQQGQQGINTATTQQPHAVAINSRQRTNDYCFNVNNRPSQCYSSSIEVSTILPLSDMNRIQLQRENSTDTTVFDIDSCTYEPVVFPCTGRQPK